MSDLADMFKKRIHQALKDNLAAGKTPSNPAELAKKMGVIPQRVYQFLNGASAPTLETVDRLCTALGVEAHDMLRPANASNDHSVEECYRRVGQAMKAPAVTPRQAAKVLRDYFDQAEADEAEMEALQKSLVPRKSG